MIIVRRQAGKLLVPRTIRLLGNGVDILLWMRLLKMILVLLGISTWMMGALAKFFSRVCLLWASLRYCWLQLAMVRPDVRRLVCTLVSCLGSY